MMPRVGNPRYEVPEPGLQPGPTRTSGDGAPPAPRLREEPRLAEFLSIV